MAYLTVAQYINRFGERETILLTNGVAPAPNVEPTYSSEKVQTAIDDAAEVVESYLSKRYAVPVIDPPRILQGFVAALAREALFVNVGKISEAAEGAADRAREQLRAIAKGTQNLPIAEGDEAPTPATGGNAETSNDRPPPSFTQSALDSFVGGIQPGGTPGGVWRNGA